MTQVLIQPAGSRDARQHFADTIASPVSQQRLAEHLPAGDLESLRDIYGDQPVPTWGFKPGKRRGGERIWEGLEPGAVVLFTGGTRVYASGVVTHKARSPELASELWRHDDPADTWEFVYFLRDIRRHAITYAELNAATGDSPDNNHQGARILHHTVGEMALRALPELARDVRRPAARDVLAGLVGRTIETISGRPNTILRLDGDRVYVATGKSPEGQPVDVSLVEDAIDRLFGDGELEINPQTVGYRSAFVGAVLKTLPGTVVDPGPPQTIRLAAARRADPPAISEAAEAEDAINQLAGWRTGQRQGRRRSAEERRAIEDHAVEMAKRFFEREQKWEVEPVGHLTCYDLHCTKDGRELHVEVKGTTTAGEKVFLTRNEVSHARDSEAEVVLYVVADIELSRDEAGKPVTRGGRVIAFQPWVIDEGQLEPVAFEYALPERRGDGSPPG